MISLRTAAAIFRRELLDIVRDRRSLFLTFLWPMMMLVLYGYGIRFDVDNVALTVLDRSHSQAGSDLVERLVASGYFRLVRRARNYREVEAELLTGRARVAVVLPVDFARAAAAGEPAPVQALIDGTDANTATIAASYLAAVIDGGGRSGARSRNPVLVTRVWYNPELKSVNFVVPGIIAVLMMIVGALLTALSMVKERERGTIEQLLTAPIAPGELIAGKLVPYVLIALLDAAGVVALGALLFRVPIHGSLLALSVFALLYLVSSLGLGLLVSTISDSMQTAMLLAFLLSLLPAILLSGFVFPLEYMPLPIQAVSYAFPGRYFVTAIRGIYLKGVGFRVLWPQAAMLLALGAGITWLSAARFRERLE